MNTDYNKQAQEFLTKTKTTLEVLEAKEQTAPLWAKKGEKHGIQYQVTLKNDRAKYVFDFWGSIRDMEMLAMAERKPWADSPEFHHVAKFLKEETGEQIAYNFLNQKNLAEKVRKAITPTAYDILACLNPLSEDNFEDFCSSFGYETDSIMALKTFEACKEQDRQLRRLFSMEELELLTNIQ